MVLSQRPVVSKLCAFVNFYLIPVISQLLSLELLAILFCCGLDFSRPRCLYPSYIRVLNLQLLDFCCSSDICARRISRTLWCSLGRWGSGEQRLDGHGHHVIYVIHNLSLRLLDTIGMDVAHMFCQHSRMCFLGFCGLRHAPFAGLALDPALVAFRDMPIF